MADQEIVAEERVLRLWLGPDGNTMYEVRRDCLQQVWEAMERTAAGTRGASELLQLPLAGEGVEPGDVVLLFAQDIRHACVCAPAREPEEEDKEP